MDKSRLSKGIALVVSGVLLVLSLNAEETDFLAVALISFLIIFLLASKKADDTKIARTPPAPHSPAQHRRPDAWEGHFQDAGTPTAMAAELWIKYRDGNGQVTERDITVREFGTYGDTVMVLAHCHMRQATRTFLVNRIIECVDRETGEVVSEIESHLRNKYLSSQEYVRDQLVTNEYDTLRVLLYVGKADGQLRSPEKAVIRDTCRALANAPELNDKLIDEVFSCMDVPSITAFKQAVGRISKTNPERGSVLFKAAQRIVATQKTISASEKEALLYLYNRFSAKQKRKNNAKAQGSRTRTVKQETGGNK